MIEWNPYVAIFLFCIGIAMVLLKRHLLSLLMGLELMLGGVNLLVVTFAISDPKDEGMVFAVFSILVSVCQVVILLSFLTGYYSRKGHLDFDW